MSSPFDAVAYATDEDVVLAARSDFAALVSDDEDVARGKDGAISSSTPWVLTSPSINFAAQGVLPGHVVILRGPRTQPAAATATALGQSGERLVVDAVAGSSATLRRAGQVPNFGHPPGLPTTLAAVDYRICTLSAQLVIASTEIRRELDFDAPLLSLVTADDLRQLCVVWLLADLYLDRARVAAGSGQVAGNQPFGGDIFSLKYREFARRRDDLLERIRSRRVPVDAVDSIGVVPIDPTS